MNINDALNLLNITETATQKEIKKAYKTACLKYHPDRNPAGAQMMIAINAAYEYLQGKGESVTPEQGFNANDYGEELNNVLNQLFALDGLELEICGNWVWISGDTKPHAKALGKNGIGCFWAKNKKMWFYRPSDYKSNGRGNWDIDQIRATHGTQKPVKSAQRAITA